MGGRIPPQWPKARHNHGHSALQVRIQPIKTKISGKHRFAVVKRASRLEKSFIALSEKHHATAQTRIQNWCLKNLTWPHADAESTLEGRDPPELVSSISSPSSFPHLVRSGVTGTVPRGLPQL